MRSNKRSARTIALDVLHAQLGGRRALTVDDGDPEKRKELSKEVVRLVRKGYLVTVGGTVRRPGKKVLGYDPETNEWLVAASTKGGKEGRVSAKSHRRATAVPALAGG